MRKYLVVLGFVLLVLTIAGCGAESTTAQAPTNCVQFTVDSGTAYNFCYGPSNAPFEGIACGGVGTVATVSSTYIYGTSAPVAPLGAIAVTPSATIQFAGFSPDQFDAVMQLVVDSGGVPLVTTFNPIVTVTQYDAVGGRIMGTFTNEDRDRHTVTGSFDVKRYADEAIDPYIMMFD